MNKIILYLSGLLFFAACSITSSEEKQLPYYGPKDPMTVKIDGKELMDTVYHTIPPFEFINQEGLPVTEQNYEGKIYVVNYFFATCPSICPIMAEQLHRVQEAFKDREDVMILSHTVDPGKDTVQALLAYAEKVHADKNKWNFVTGERKALYEQALYGYFLNAMEDVLAPGGFLHSEQVILVDRQSHIRGIYDGTEAEEIDQLIEDIRLLLKSEN